MIQSASKSASDLTLDPEPPYPGAVRRGAADEWADWYQWDGNDPFEDATGPFYAAREAGGAIITGFRPGQTNRNGHGMIHGGALMTFADFSLFMIAASQGEGISGVTVTMTSEFLSPAQAGELLIGRGERTGGGRSLVMARGIISAGDRPVLSFSGVIKRFAQRP
ncbi:PaaI family thioesterase [Novosphingobium sp.]|uniref:PaaI family thioesterase n=1 Tax=Novosphingobium sp. TaxID=1874826 RepID=UPI003B517434